MKKRIPLTAAILMLFAMIALASWAGLQSGAQNGQKGIKALPIADTSTHLVQQGRSEETGGEMHVQNIQGQVVGRVVAVAERFGELAYILIVKNGSVGELTPIPVDAAFFDPQKNAIIVHAADPELAEAPSLTPDELQKLDDPDFEHRVHGYYEQEADEREPSGKFREPGSSESQGKIKVAF